MYLREYETIVIVNPETGTDGIDKVLERSRDAFKKTKAQEIRYEDWGVRRLAYTCKKQRRGNYLYLNYLGSETTVAELERLLRITEASMLFQTVLLDGRVDPKAFDFESAKSAKTRMLEKASEKKSEEASAPAEPAAESSEPAATEEVAKEAGETPAETTEEAPNA